LVKEGSLPHVKGFILNKLFEKGCFTGISRGKHMPERDLRTSYPRQFHGLFENAVDALYRESLIDKFPARTGRGSEPHVAIFRSKLLEARPQINAYRRSAGLPRLRRDFKEFIEVRCPSCNAINYEDMIFCQNCGIRIIGQ